MFFYTLAYHELLFSFKFFLLITRVPYSVSVCLYCKHNIWQDGGIRARVAATAAWCATIGLRLTHELEVNMMPETEVKGQPKC